MFSQPIIGSGKAFLGFSLVLMVVAGISPTPVNAQVASGLPAPRGITPPSNFPPDRPLPDAAAPENPLPDNAYVLGSGDIVRIDIFDTPELKLEERYTVLVDGTLNLPWVGSVPVAGLTLQQAAAELSRQYSRFIKQPIVTLSSLSPRPLKIAVLGQVNRPGSYIIRPIGDESSTTNLSIRQGGTDVGSQWPTLTRAIQAAGGVTQSADIRDIQVRRVQDGTEKVFLVDLWKFLQSADQHQDLTLRDGDSILVKEATDLPPQEALEVAQSNISPESIKVGVVGEVVAPGSLALPPNSSLNQAILAAGGFKSNRAQKGDVELIRLNLNGTVSRTRIAIDFSKGLDAKTNPPLRNNDVVIVKPNTLAKTSDLLNAVLSPITSAFGFLKLFGF